MEVWGGYFACQNIWDKLQTSQDELLHIQTILRSSITNDGIDIDLTNKEIGIIVNSVELTLEKLGEEDMHVHTGIEYKEAVQLYEELKKL